MYDSIGVWGYSHELHQESNYAGCFKISGKFGEMEVFPLTQDYIANPEKLKNIWVYDDEFVKGMIHIEGKAVIKLYADFFFHNQGIGAKLMEFAIRTFDVSNLFMLEKNSNAISSYQRFGFSSAQERLLEKGTTEYVAKMER